MTNYICLLKRKVPKTWSYIKIYSHRYSSQLMDVMKDIIEPLSICLSLSRSSYHLLEFDSLVVSCNDDQLYIYSRGFKKKLYIVEQH